MDDGWHWGSWEGGCLVDPKCALGEPDFCLWAMLHESVCVPSVCCLMLASLPSSDSVLSPPQSCISSPPALSRGERLGTSVPAHPSFPAKINRHSPLSRSLTPGSYPSVISHPQAPACLLTLRFGSRLTWSLHPSKATVGKSSSNRGPRQRTGLGPQTSSSGAPGL